MIKLSLLVSQVFASSSTLHLCAFSNIDVLIPCCQPSVWTAFFFFKKKPLLQIRSNFILFLPSFCFYLFIFFVRVCVRKHAETSATSTRSLQRWWWSWRQQTSSSSWTLTRTSFKASPTPTQNSSYKSDDFRLVRGRTLLQLVQPSHISLKTHPASDQDSEPRRLQSRPTPASKLGNHKPSH